MARREIKDAQGNKIGALDEQPNQSIAYDAKGKRIGRFDKKLNETFDGAGVKIGKGDLIMARVFKIGPGAPKKAPTQEQEEESYGVVDLSGE
ncbi:MAG: hypothetical protein HYV07_10955 [Deltaproteobacteria bacterium]|nr:hypothetical protein [Deltaproteobacteria bacterium]